MAQSGALAGLAGDEPWTPSGGAISERRSDVDDDEPGGHTAAAKARIGTVLREKYRLDRLLGVGGMGAVYAATHVRNGRSVAIKILHPELAGSVVLRANLLFEARSSNSVRHPGVVQVLDDDVTEDGTVFLVMELLDGESLQARWRRDRGWFDEERIAALVHRLLDALAAVHEHGILHCDIKPDNIHLLPDGTVKILDFGIARPRNPDDAPSDRSGTVGTPGFMAPEQVLGVPSEIDERSDLWAVGALAYRLLTGLHVHEGSMQEQLACTVSTPVRPLASVRPGVSPSLAAVVDRALRLDKDARWQDSRSMQAALESAISAAPRSGPHWSALVVPASGARVDCAPSAGTSAESFGRHGTLRSASPVGAPRPFLRRVRDLIAGRARPRAWGQVS